MRTRLIVAVVVIVAVSAIAAWRLRTAGGPEVAAPIATAAISEVTPPENPSPPAPGTSAPAASESPEPSESPTESAPEPSATVATPTPVPAVAPQPTGLSPNWKQPTDRQEGGAEGDLVVRTGDINNLGYGWPLHFTPFSGQSTPAHPYPCQPRYGAPAGTDRIMVGSSVTDQDLRNKRTDGYSGCSSRPDNLPQAVRLTMGRLPAQVRSVFVQMFLDDFQPKVWHSRFQVSLNGTRIPSYEDTINELDQTGPIGKLLTLRLLPEYWPILRQGDVALLIDDPTTHIPDGYAIDFVRVLVNPRFRYVVSIACNVSDAATNKSIKAATVSAAQVTVATDAAGTCTLRGVPAGLVSVSASAVGYDANVQLLDLPAGTRGVANFALHRHSETVGDLKRRLEQTGTVAIYGIHFDTASAKIRTNSTPSLLMLRKLMQGSPSGRWIVAGHTDNQGGAAYNLNLSEARARSVIVWLSSHGIPNDRLKAVGYGLTRPVADNGTDSGRALNRRVEVTVVR